MPWAPGRQCLLLSIVEKLGQPGWTQEALQLPQPSEITSEPQKPHPLIKLLADRTIQSGAWCGLPAATAGLSQGGSARFGRNMNLLLVNSL